MNNVQALEALVSRVRDAQNELTAIREAIVVHWASGSLPDIAYGKATAVFASITTGLGIVTAELEIATNLSRIIDAAEFDEARVRA